MAGLARAETVVISDAVEPLVRKAFDLETRPLALVKGVAAPVAHHEVIGARSVPVKVSSGAIVDRDRELDRLVKCWTRAQAGRDEVAAHLGSV